jgi:hypothetical protein
MAGSKGSWGGTKEAMEKQGSSTYLRLENDGDKAVVAFCGAPFHREITFNEKTGQYEPWTDESKGQGRKKTSRYAMNVYVIKDGKGVESHDIRVLDMNFSTMQQVWALKDKYTLGKMLFEITRHGAKKDTKTTYQILPDAPITDAVRSACGYQDPKHEDNWIDGTLPLLDLEETTSKVEDETTAVSDDVKKPETSKVAKSAGTNGTTDKPATPAPAPAPASTAGGTLAKAVVNELIGKLKVLDKDKGVLPFLAKFPYAKKVSEVRAHDEAAARALVAELSGTSVAEEDPFA